MNLTAVILLIALGLVLILVEVLIIPGSTFFGLIGIVLIIIGIVFSFQITRSTGYITLCASVLLVSLLAFWGARAKTWQIFEVKSKITGFSSKKISALKVGDTGITATRCNPIGKAIFKDKIKEVYSAKEMLEKDIKIKISRIENNQIFVKPI